MTGYNFVEIALAPAKLWLAEIVTVGNPRSMLMRLAATFVTPVAPGTMWRLAAYLLAAAGAVQTVRGADAQSLLPVPSKLADARATPAARKLFRDLLADYGKRTWSGQQEVAEIAHIHGLSARKPLIVEGDFMDYSPSRVAYGKIPADYTENLLAQARAGHVLAFSWHWNAPTNLLDTSRQRWWRGFYTEATRFNLAAALANTNSVEYSLILRDIDAIAAQLRKLSEADIPVLWRPLHESEGGWFWWGAKGPEPFKQLWRLLYQRLTDHHGLHNLIWVLTSENPKWYPGDDVVDVIGVDAYPKDRADLLLPRWQALKERFNGRKLIALTEFGGVPDIERMQQAGVWWSWFLSWTGQSGPTSMPAAAVVRTYTSPGVATLENHPRQEAR